MENAPHHIEVLIIKFLEREASPEDVDTLKVWLAENPLHKKYFNEVNQTFQATITVGKINQEKIDKGWKNVAAKIQSIHPVYNFKHRDHQNTTSFMKLAASLTAIVLMGLAAWHFLKPPFSTNTHTTISSSKRLNTKVLLPDGSVVLLNANSTLDYGVEFGVNNREVKLKGEAYFDVRKGDKPFIVKTQNISVMVKGTRFNVRAYANEENIKTTLEEGKVELLVEGERDVYTMNPGDQITFNATDKKITHSIVDPSNYTSWKEETLVFDDTPLRDIVLKLENRYKIDIQVDSTIAQREHLTMTIDQESVDEVLEFIRLSSRLKFKKENNKILIYE